MMKVRWKSITKKQPIFSNDQVKTEETRDLVYRIKKFELNYADREDR